MTPNQFWRDEPQLYYVYEKAFERKRSSMLEIQDMLNWELGYYIGLQISISLGGKCKYPKKPCFHRQERELTEEEKQRLEQVNAEIREHNAEIAKMKSQILKKYNE